MITAEHVETHEPWLLPYLPDIDGHTMLDIGAHIGTFAMDMLDHFEVVHAFEPSPRVAEVLRFNLRDAMTVGQAYVHEVAVGENDGGQVELKLYQGSMQASIYGDDDLDTAPRGPAWSSVNVLERSLDGMGFAAGEPVDYIKCDVEGAEIAVLRGAAQTLKNHRPQLLIEIHTLDNRAAAVELLEPDYDLTLIPHPHQGVSEGHSWIAARAR